MNKRIFLAKIGIVSSICIACLGWLYADFDHGSRRTAYQCLPNHKWYSLKGCIEDHYILLREGETTERYRRMLGYWESDILRMKSSGSYDYPDAPPIEWERNPVWISYRSVLTFCILLFSASLTVLLTIRQVGKDVVPQASDPDHARAASNGYIGSQLKTSVLRYIIALQVAIRDGQGSVSGMWREVWANLAVIFMLIMFAMPLLLMVFFFVIQPRPA